MLVASPRFVDPRLVSARRRVRIVGRADRVLLADLTAATLNDQLAATTVFEVAASRINGVALRPVQRARARGIRILHLPSAVAIRRDEPAVIRTHSHQGDGWLGRTDVRCGSIR